MKKLLVIMLALLMLVPIAAACGKKEKEKETKPRVETIYNFDSYAHSFQLMKISNFGNIEQNSDTQYIKKGGGSAKLQPLGAYSSHAKPILWLPTTSILFEFDYADFGDIEYVSTEFYNTLDHDIKIYTGLVFSADGKIRNKETTYTLKPGWNTCLYKIDQSLISLAFDITKCFGIYYSFDYVESRELEDAPVIYMDEVTLMRYEKQVEHQDLIVLKPNEVADFEELYQENIIDVLVRKQSTFPEYGVINLAQHTDNKLTASSGEKVLRVVTKPGDRTEDTWPSLIISEKVIRKVNFSQYDDTAKFKFDVYNNSKMAKSFFVEFYKSDSTQDDKGVAAIEAVPNKWVTFSISMAELNKLSKGDYAKDLKQIRLAWGEYIGDSQEFFFDNFRIEI